MGSAFERTIHAYLLPMLRGAEVTVELTVLGAALACFMAFLAGLVGVSRHRTARGVARFYVEFFRGSSELVQLFWIFYALPILTGFHIERILAGVLAIGLNLGAYGSEVVRGAVLAVPREQYEAGVALNFTRMQRFRRIIVPQAIPEMLPPFNNLFIQLAKTTALVSLITLADMTYEGNNILRPTHLDDTLVIFLALLFLYLILSLLITALMRLLEWWANASVGKVEGPGALLGRAVGRLAPVRAS